jgi:hypothetical protein
MVYLVKFVLNIPLDENIIDAFFKLVTFQNWLGLFFT